MMLAIAFACSTRVPSNVVDAATAERECGEAGQQLALNSPADVASLVGCTHLLGSLRIGDSLLANVDGLESLRAIDETVTFFRNPNLTSLEGLRSLERIGGDLNLNDNPGLIDLEGLRKLREVGGWLLVKTEGALLTLHGLDALRTVGSLSIIVNPKLANIDALSAFQVVAGDLTITNNTALAQSTALGFATRITVGGKTDVADNGP
ncbi:hypothetical protein BH09MYX1_BH09MYX1_52670 [soil metagenome]